MQKNILLLHGNGGTSTRFIPFLNYLKQSNLPLEAHIPKLPGFEGRPLPKSDNYWDLFLEAVEQTVSKKEGEWIFYGHGIGGSVLLELAARDYTFPSGKQVKPTQVILHSCIGASLQHRFFPKLMKPLFVRRFIKRMVYTKALQSFWEKKLFLYPSDIDQAIKNQFFADYKNCQAFETFFDLITPAWYSSVQSKTKEQPFFFLWGDKERVVASKYLSYWQRDFTKASFETVKGWDHFPMLDTPKSFFDKITSVVL